jgi:hypothetical protein
VKTVTLILIFGVIGFFIGVFFVHLLFELGGPPLALVGGAVAIPLGIAGGVAVGYIGNRL